MADSTRPCRGGIQEISKTTRGDESRPAGSSLAVHAAAKQLLRASVAPSPPRADSARRRAVADCAARPGGAACSASRTHSQAQPSFCAQLGELGGLVRQARGYFPAPSPIRPAAFLEILEEQLLRPAFPIHLPDLVQQFEREIQPRPGETERPPWPRGCRRSPAVRPPCAAAGCGSRSRPS